jgi:D-3-phosphoglycerate dehydrogenase / 2-oxoglutarate reductase
VSSLRSSAARRLRGRSRRVRSKRCWWYAALTAGTIAGAGIDVFDPEPPPPDHPLLQLANVVTSPHMAGVTRESIDRMAVQAAYNVLSVFDGKPIRENAFNPEVSD